jgi:GT2 family glycosyltransferase
MASPVIRNAGADSEVQFCGGFWDGCWAEGTADLAIYRAWAAQHPERIWLSGTALLIRRALIEAIGRFDDRFFAYWEDVDYSVRAIAAGYRNVIVTHAEVYHAPIKSQTALSGRPPHASYYMVRNELLFTRRHVGWWAGRRPLYWAVRRALANALGQKDEPALVDANFLGLRDGLVCRYGPYDAARRLPAPVRKLLLTANRVLFGSQ